MRRKRLWRNGAIVVLLAALIGLWLNEPAANSASGGEASGRRMLRTELYLEAVELSQWEDFLAREVTPRFPDGLSWLDLHGQWRGPSGGPEKLPSRMLILIHADNPYTRQALAQIGADFKQRFGTAVLQVSSPVRARDPDWTPQRLDNPQLSR
ncbi:MULTISPECIES: DUF3574 domain-containing protein [Pseudomonas]|uniref:DUF3574 domain-containing protein n=1 Tax=Pseudomonas nitroreducens TaxID=46680 RepID=A0A6G6IZS8_PSENT|nr:MULTISPECIES: DUF3574 domain-containing protein [Pseudomonas]NNN26511.1 DUF3574 domain-containing protein [Pseudomonas nitroreducens]QIE88310.1 DUF3574 domain-containing protein [Pseudomonas nitroreducens]UCL84874.1 DUF3574 domain-containing protein [Pseudomonas sp. HS-18]